MTPNDREPQLPNPVGDGDRARGHEPMLPGATVTGLREKLRDGRTSAVRAYAARLLGRLGPSAEPAVPDLVEAARDADNGVCMSALTALGEIVGEDQRRRLAGWAWGRIENPDPKPAAGPEISSEEARRIAFGLIGPDCGLIEELTKEEPYGWYFHHQSRKYLETRDVSFLLIASGGFVVERFGGRIVTFGSACTFEENLRRYLKGFCGQSDLIITRVLDIDVAVELIARLQMRFVIPEEAHGVTWRIPQQFSADMIRDRLGELPCVFENQSFFFRAEVFDEIDARPCLVYWLREHRPPA